MSISFLITTNRQESKSIGRFVGRLSVTRFVILLNRVSKITTNFGNPFVTLFRITSKRIVQEIPGWSGIEAGIEPSEQPGLALFV